MKFEDNAYITFRPNALGMVDGRGTVDDEEDGETISEVALSKLSSIDPSSWPGTHVMIQSGTRTFDYTSFTISVT